MVWAKFILFVAAAIIGLLTLVICSLQLLHMTPNLMGGLAGGLFMLALGVTGIHSILDELNQP